MSVLPGLLSCFALLFCLAASSWAAPPTPTGLAATSGIGQATLSWNASSGATLYKLHRATSYSGWVTVVTQSGRTYTDTGLNAGTTYYYKIAAIDSSGESAFSGQVPAYPPQSTVTGLSAQAQNGQVGLVWNSVPGNKGYRIKCGTSIGNYTLVQTTNWWEYFYTWTGLTPGTTYYFVVQALAEHPNGDGAFSSPVSATPYTTPSTPTGLSAVAGNSQITLDWNDATNASSYKVKRSTTSGGPYSVVASPTASAYNNTGLTNGTTYYYVVSASGPGGESGNSGQVSATPQQPVPSTPGAPSISNITNTSMRVTAPILPANADSLTLQKKLTGANDTTYVNVAADLTALAETDVTGLSAQTGYTFRYLAVNGAGTAAGASAAATTLPNAPALPQRLCLMRRRHQRL